MKIYKVGGCVRDTLLGIEPKDTDFVVVGSTPEEMVALGYEKVGASFPVFLKDGCEYALARTERKVGVGYHGFETSYDTSVTLEDDLLRRDLTINSMAMDENGTIIDPYGGQRDLRTQTLRHTSEAFAEDPVRVLRTARFSARYAFFIAYDTIELMRKIAPELDHVPQERIWAEFEKGLMEKYPQCMLQALRDCGAMEVSSLMPYSGAKMYLMEEFSTSLGRSADLETRFALISTNFRDNDYEYCRIPASCSKMAKLFNTTKAFLYAYETLEKVQRLELLYTFRIFNDIEPLWKCVEALKFVYERTRPVERLIESDIEKVQFVDVEKTIGDCKDGARIKEKLFQARLAALSS